MKFGILTISGDNFLILTKRNFSQRSWVLNFTLKVFGYRYRVYSFVVKEIFFYFEQRKFPTYGLFSIIFILDLFLKEKNIFGKDINNIYTYRILADILWFILFEFYFKNIVFHHRFIPFLLHSIWFFSLSLSLDITPLVMRLLFYTHSLTSYHDDKVFFSIRRQENS